jgi:hypothetical protein
VLGFNVASLNFASFRFVILDLVNSVPISIDCFNIRSIRARCLYLWQLIDFVKQSRLMAFLRLVLNI